MPVDGVPLVGRAAPRSRRLLIATGFGKWGMTGGTAAAELLADLVQGQDNPLERLLDPIRLTPRSATAIAEENARNALRFVRDALPARSRVAIGDLAAGRGSDRRSRGRAGRRAPAPRRQPRRRLAAVHAPRLQGALERARRAGTAPATDPASTPRAKCCTGRLCTASRPSRWTSGTARAGCGPRSPRRARRAGARRRPLPPRRSRVARPAARGRTARASVRRHVERFGPALADHDAVERVAQGHDRKLGRGGSDDAQVLRLQCPLEPRVRVSGARHGARLYTNTCSLLRSGRKVRAVLAVVALPALLLALAPYQSSIEPLPRPLKAQLKTRDVWHRGCPVPLSGLRC